MSIDLPGILDERARELSWEEWRRNDLIRFGQSEVEYPFPGDLAVSGYVPGIDKSTFRRIVPFPRQRLEIESETNAEPPATSKILPASAYQAAILFKDGGFFVKSR